MNDIIGNSSKTESLPQQMEGLNGDTVTDPEDSVSNFVQYLYFTKVGPNQAE